VPGAAWLSALALIAPAPAAARTFLTQQQALDAAFPSGTTPQREAHFLTPAQLERAKRLSEGAAAEELVVRYAGLREGRIVGYAYFDSHRVRTLGETLMVVVSPEGQVEKVELLSFDEPPDYQPRRPSGPGRSRPWPRPHAMSRSALVTLHALVAVLTATGAVFAWMKYGLRAEDPFAVANHPWQPHVLAAHVLAAPLGVFALGWLFSAHVWPKYRGPMRSRRRTGLVMMAVLLPMVISAYVLQAVTAETARWGAAAAHWITSGIFALGYAAHLLGPRGRAGGQA
jgi:hypothetical protein